MSFLRLSHLSIFINMDKVIIDSIMTLNMDKHLDGAWDIFWINPDIDTFLVLQMKFLFLYWHRKNSSNVELSRSVYLFATCTKNVIVVHEKFSFCFLNVDQYSFLIKIPSIFPLDTYIIQEVFSNFSCMFLNPKNFFQSILLIYQIWETSRNKLKKYSVTESCSDLSLFE